MMRMLNCSLLLFSFCLVFLGCRRAESSLDQLALRGSYEQLEAQARKEFSRTYHKSSLYYIALAQERTGKFEQAHASLRLYVAMTTRQETSVAAANLAVLLGNRVGDIQLVIDMGLFLEEQNALDEHTAEALYQALLAERRTEDAQRIFSTYLKGTMDSLGYARVLVQAQASLSLIKEAFSDLESEEVVEMLQVASEFENNVQRSYEYLVVGQSYEHTNLDGIHKKILYTALARFASQADQRVQANKYQGLANTVL